MSTNFEAGFHAAPGRAVDASAYGPDFLYQRCSPLPRLRWDIEFSISLPERVRLH
jgi:hypothetical protein